MLRIFSRYNFRNKTALDKYRAFENFPFVDYNGVFYEDAHNFKANKLDCIGLAIYSLLTYCRKAPALQVVAQFRFYRLYFAAFAPSSFAVLFAFLPSRSRYGEARRVA